MNISARFRSLLHEYLSARAKMRATLSTDIAQISVRSHSRFKSKTESRSAIGIMSNAKSASSTIQSSAYMKLRSSCNCSNVMSSNRTLPSICSRNSEENSARKYEERLAKTHLCAATSSDASEPAASSTSQLSLSASNCRMWSSSIASSSLMGASISCRSNKVPRASVSRYAASSNTSAWPFGRKKIPHPPPGRSSLASI
mmetsp:Transcript_91444/g.217908  ORF Transcript_91444/g.217908 Transcript_91444/m.217908 type:complete len:200 (+) Transcript_91444:860-1459(+)